MGEFKVYVKDPARVNKFFDDLVQRYSVDVWQGGALTGLELERDDTKARAPNWMGHLFDSIIAGVELGSPVFGILESTSTYSKYREFGTVRHFVPAKYIGQWAQFHVGRFTGLVVTGEATPFFRKSKTETLKDVARRVGGTVVKSMIEWFKDNS